MEKYDIQKKLSEYLKKNNTILLESAEKLSYRSSVKLRCNKCNI